MEIEWNSLTFGGHEIFLVLRFHAKIVFFLFVGGHMPQTPRLTSNPYIY
jgi:hypothetical protein